jgi:SpoVK/Ycf46/Vps4 family AAA+-type ATPase
MNIKLLLLEQPTLFHPWTLLCLELEDLTKRLKFHVQTSKVAKKFYNFIFPKQKFPKVCFFIFLTKDLNMDKISSLTPGFTGADLENLVNLASVNASKNNKTAIDMQDMDYAFDRVVIGLENRSLNRILTDNEKMKTAIHVSS